MREIFEQCTISNNQIKLPNIQLERSLYLKVSKSLTALGGKWVGGKTQAFVFNFDPTAHLNRLIDGETDVKKKIQFFPTPKDLAAKLVGLVDLNESHSILEPSAGQGSLIDAIRNTGIMQQIHICEIDPVNVDILNKKYNDVYILANDFLTLNPENSLEFYDRIIANPPFSHNQDIKHIMKMYACLKTNGVLVSFASTSWQHTSTNVAKQFRAWLEDVNAEVIDIDKGAFSESGTQIPTVILKIRKR